MARLPRGTVTLLFTDIEGSTRLLQELGSQRYVRALEQHRRLLREAFRRHGGVEVEMQGDSFHVAFASPRAAVAAAADAQRALAESPWESAPIRVRMGMHTGQPLVTGNLYAGLDVHRAARVMAAGHGGQVLVSQTTCERLGDGLPPGLTLRDLGEHRLKDLAEAVGISQLCVDGLPAEFPPLQSLANRPTNLPAPASPLVGRERELAGARELVLRDDVRLVTMTGPGGTGKTRLALALAPELIESFPAGVWFVNLAPLADPALVLPAVAAALGVREQAGEPLGQTLAEHLRQKAVLLVLDNFEHLLPAAPTVSALLAESAGSKLLATSRARLSVAGEHVYPVPPLALPDPEALPPLEQLARNDAVALFVTRAEAARGDFELTRENARAIAEICVRLDGLPLALELAAARIPVLSPQSLLARLDQRLGVLTRGARDAVERQQTLAAAIDWSHDLLDDPEQTLFPRLAVFAGGCTLDTAEAVCDPHAELDLFDAISTLVDKSLVLRADAGGGEPRFAMLETIREYAANRLERSGELDQLRAAHAAHFMRRADRSGPEGRREDVWVAQLARDEDNLRAALSELLRRGQGDEAVRFCLSLFDFWEISDRMTEGDRWFERALELPVDRGLRARGLAWQVALAAHANDLARARRLGEESCAIARELGDRETLAWGLLGVAMTRSVGGEHEQAAELLEEALALHRECGSRQGERNALQMLGEVQLERGDFEGAARLLEASVALSRTLGDHAFVLATRHTLGDLELERGDLAAAEDHYRAILADPAGTPPLIAAWCVGGLAATAARRGADRRAARLWRSLERFETERSIPIELAIRRRYERALSGVELGSSGDARPLDEAVAHALAG